MGDLFGFYLQRSWLKSVLLSSSRPDFCLILVSNVTGQIKVTTTGETNKLETPPVFAGGYGMPEIFTGRLVQRIGPYT